MMKTHKEQTQKVHLNTNIRRETEQELFRLKRELRAENVKSSATSKGSIIDILVSSPEALQILRRALL